MDDSTRLGSIEARLSGIEHTLETVASRMGTIAEGYESLRRVTIDEFAGVRHSIAAVETRIRALDRDVEGIARYIAGGEA